MYELKPNYREPANVLRKDSIKNELDNSEFGDLMEEKLAANRDDFKRKSTWGTFNKFEKTVGVKGGQQISTVENSAVEGGV